MKILKWVSFVLVGFLFLIGSSSSFVPPDNYLIACGSSQNITFQTRSFVPDSQHSSLVLKSGDSVVASSNSSVPSPIYQSARIFTSRASYKFKIEQQGRHWLRLYFFPHLNSSHTLSSASFTVVTDNFVLLSNFTFRNYNGSYMFKEYAVNVTSDTLTLTFIPSNGSVTFVNAIEVVSMPNDLFVDQAFGLDPPSPFNGLSELALETVYRLNMGGPLLTAQNDTLGRTWVNDLKYLHVNSSVFNVSVNPASIKYPTTLTQDTAPNWVYATADVMGDANVANTNFNITWVFPVDPSFSYLVRVHLCDIMSKSLNSLVFNLYINSDLGLGSFDLSSLTGDLAVPYYKDFVSKASADSNTLSVSVGPDNMADNRNATMNGLEIMKISNELKSLDGLASVESLLPSSDSKASKIGIIVGSVVGSIIAIALVGLCCFCFVGRKSKTTQPGHSWLPLPLYGNSQTMTKMSTTSQKSGTASCISLASSNLGRFFNFQEILDATNKFDEKLLLGVGGFGRVYKGTLEDGTNVAVKRGNPRSEQGLAEFRTEIEMEQVNIAEWAMTWQKKGMLDQIMDQNLVGHVNPASLKKFGETAEKCLAEHGVDRPSMGDVLWNLEYALQLEETSSALMEPEDNSTNHITGIQLTPLEPFDNSVSMIDGGISGTDDDAEDVATSAVFSQIVNPRGR
ncbi:receptor-like protein kinase THESEUS 1 [Senna tora]|uniref:Receptor-like protein kinase THESEUS 1 n=1 Tax=Senna tora TaxID=362788 RepID=A0A834TKY8_9FABA|nr:receptor-like protein kinase THESEUS 1 [Senna tora]